MKRSKLKCISAEDLFIEKCTSLDYWLNFLTGAGEIFRMF